MNEYSSDDFCLYGKEDGELALDRLYWWLIYPDVVDDCDVYPADVVEQKSPASLLRRKQLIDVLSVVLLRKPDASPQDLVEALNYYQQHDSFMPFEP